MDLLGAEAPGPIKEKLTPRIARTAKALWGIYALLTVLQVAALVLCGMDPLEAVNQAFSTMATGGFSTRNASIAGFGNPAIEVVVLLFMVLAGANFALHFHVMRGDAQPLLHDREFRFYVGLLAAATVVLSTDLVLAAGLGVLEALRLGSFQVVSIMTSTGFASTDFATWPVVSLLTLFALMFVGGSAGSTSGGIKVVRHLLLGKMLRRELDQTVSPEVVLPVRLNGSPVDERTLRAIAAFILLYVGFWAVGAAAIAIESAIGDVGIGALDALAISASAVGNVGPSFGVTGPMGSYEPLGDVSKLTMIVLMWVGRLEIVPVAVLLTRHYWRI